MKWYIATPILLVFGIGFWILLDVYKALPGGSFLDLDAAAFVGLGAWLLACWSGMIIRSWPSAPRTQHRSKSTCAPRGR